MKNRPERLGVNARFCTGKAPEKHQPYRVCVCNRQPRTAYVG